MSLSIIGVRGVGKTNIARRVSLLTRLPVLSTDVLVSYDNDGLSIPQMVAADGGDWRRFRDLEFAVIDKLSRMHGLVVDCGGGVVVDLDAAGREVYSRRKVALLKAAGPVVWLTGDIDRLAAKVAGDRRRPALDATRSAAEVMRQRVPFYERAADITVDVEGRDPGEIAEELAGVMA